MGDFSVAAKITQKMSDSDASLINTNALEAYLKFFPSGSSYRCLDHYRQVYITDEFKKYDFGSAELNQKKYGEDTPPLYDWKAISGFKIALICGTGDLLASPKDYKQINDAFVESGLNEVYYHEYPQGHLGLVCPKTSEPTDKMFELIKENH